MRNFGIMRYFLPILFVLLTLFVSCDMGKSTTTETSSEARVHNFSFYTDTLNPGLTEATYKVEHLSDTGFIYNKDSLRFGTRLDSVVPYVTYKETPGTATFVLPDTTIVSTGTDTMDLSQDPIYLHVVASDMKSERWYRIKLSVHQVDPDLYVWKKLQDQIFSKQNCQTKAFWHRNKLALFVNNGLSTQIYQSNNGSNWQQLTQSVEQLPTPCQVRDIVLHHDTLYYIEGNTLYYSDDLVHWEQKDYSDAAFAPINMLVSYNELAWCLVQDTANQQLMLAAIHTDSIAPLHKIDGVDNGYLPATFPINDFAALEFGSSSERPRAMIVGGRSMNGEAINTRWNLEYSSNSGYRLKDFSISQPSFQSLTGASIIQYDDQLLMFGGIDNDLTWRANMLYSKDEGMHWYVPDSAHNQLPSNYETRQYQSVVVDSHKNIYIIGGQTHTESFSDVYLGYRNAEKWD